MIDILYFASLRETLDLDQEQIELPADIDTVAELKQWLAARGERWQDMFSQNGQMLVSVNQHMSNDNSPVKDGDEVGFFPPVTGG